jgi:hypothetical protein
MKELQAPREAPRPLKELPVLQNIKRKKKLGLPLLSCIRIGIYWPIAAEICNQC